MTLESLCVLKLVLFSLICNVSAGYDKGTCMHRDLKKNGEVGRAHGPWTTSPEATSDEPAAKQVPQVARRETVGGSHVHAVVQVFGLDGTSIQRQLQPGPGDLAK